MTYFYSYALDETYLERLISEEFTTHYIQSPLKNFNRRLTQHDKCLKYSNFRK